MPTLLEQITDFIVDAPAAEDPRIMHAVHVSYVDTLGCIFAGSQTDVAVNACKVLMAAGTGDKDVFGADISLPPGAAAMANAVAGHALDFDDCDELANAHPGTVLLPVLLAASHNDNTFQDFADAYALGIEVLSRLGEALNFEHYRLGWHTTGTLACFAATAALARLLTLSKDQTCHALSLTLSQMAGMTCQFGSDAKPLQAGFAARNAYHAVEFARAGLTGQKDALDGQKGYASLTGHGDPERIRTAFARPGPPAILSPGIWLKPWPTCSYTHRLICCARDIRERHRPNYDHIVRMDAYLPDFHAAILPFHAPISATEAAFSLPFCITMGLVTGEVTLSHLEGELWHLTPITQLMTSINIHPVKPRNPDLNFDANQPDRLVVTLADGTTYESTCAYPLGHARNPMSEEERRTKFEMCVPGGGAAFNRMMNMQTSDVIFIVTNQSTS